MLYYINNSRELNRFVSSNNMAAVMFYAPWCKYSLKLNPIFESISQKYSGIISVKVNLDAFEYIALQYGIRETPIIKFFSKSIQIGEIVGYLDAESLEKEIDKMFGITTASIFDSHDRIRSHESLENTSSNHHNYKQCKSMVCKMQQN